MNKITEDFENWLKGQAGQVIVGYACSQKDNPVARFISQKYRRAVLIQFGRVEMVGGSFPLPQELLEFLELLGTKFRPITAREAAFVLAGACVFAR